MKSQGRLVLLVLPGNVTTELEGAKATLDEAH